MITISEIIKQVLEWFEDAPEDAKLEFLSANTLDYHETLGRQIRNQFGLWQRPWTPELINGVDAAIGHPDNLSQYIIQEVQRRARDDHESNG